VQISQLGQQNRPRAAKLRVVVTYEGFGALGPVEVGNDGARDGQGVLVARGVVVGHAGHPVYIRQQSMGKEVCGPQQQVMSDVEKHYRGRTSHIHLPMEN
jgi:hypothetical protein